MILKNASFAKWSKPFCWVVAAVCLLIAVATFMGDGENRMLIGILWIGGMLAFIASGAFLGKISNEGS